MQRVFPDLDFSSDTMFDADFNDEGTMVRGMLSFSTHARPTVLAYSCLARPPNESAFMRYLPQYLLFPLHPTPQLLLSPSKSLSAPY